MDELGERLAKALGPDYELGPEIGRGGMGVVYQATDTRLRREVAIKVLPPELSFRRELRERFVFEAQLSAGLNHPHIVPIFDVGDRDGLVWYVMALVDGESARAKVQRDGPLTSAQARRIVREVAWALAYAHARGIVHRDIKPDNILLERETGRALVTDFGIAKLAETDTPGGATKPGTVLGSLMYMAPEQATGDAPIDGRADLYALGLTGYFLVAGRPPFSGANVVAVAARVATGLTPDWEATTQRLDPGLRHILERCTAVAVEDRWGGAEEILEALGPEALAPRPMPASIRRLVRDFMLIPTVGFIILVIDLVAERPTTSEFIAWLALVVVVNFGVTLRAFSRRRFGWADLRDGLEMELARQAEEFEATGALRQRFSAIVHLATFAAIAVSLLRIPIEQGMEPLLPIALAFVALAGLATVPVAWIQIKIYSFLGRVGLKLLPSLPRPEGPGWFSRFADRLLTKLFRPVHLRSALHRLPPGGTGPAAAPGVTSGWRASEVGAARRSAASIDDLFGALPRDMRDQTRDARRIARDLTAAVDELRHRRADLERLRERELESLTSSSRHATLALDRLRAALQDLIAGEGDVDNVAAVLRSADAILRRSGADQEPQPPGKKRRISVRNWLGIQLDASVTGRSQVEVSPHAVPPLAREVTAAWERHGDRDEHLRDRGADVQAFIDRVGDLQAMLHRRSERGDDIDPAAVVSITQCEAVLHDLLDALNRYDGEPGSTGEIDRLVRRMAAMEAKIDGALEE